MSAPRSGTDWMVVRKTLEARGLWNEDGVTRRARARTCRGCGRPVMVGLDADTAALAITADPFPLSALGEAVTLLQDRATYSLAFVGGRYELDYRDEWRIRSAPAESSGRFEILGEHKCGAAESPEQLRASVAHIPKQQPVSSDKCPF